MHPVVYNNNKLQLTNKLQKEKMERL